MCLLNTVNQEANPFPIIHSFLLQLSERKNLQCF